MFPVWVWTPPPGAPGPGARPGNTQFLLDPLVIGLQICVTNRPILRYTVQRLHDEVAFVHAQGHHAVVNSAAAHTFARYIRPKFNWIFASCYAWICPVKLLGTFFVRNKVTLWHPMRTRLQHHDPESSL